MLSDVFLLAMMLLSDGFILDGFSVLQRIKNGLIIRDVIIDLI